MTPPAHPPFATRRPSLFAAAMGDVVAGDAVAGDGGRGGRIVSPAGPSGHLLYGPYEMRLPGRYRVLFDVALSGPAPAAAGDAPCVLVDIVADTGGTVLAERRVTIDALRASGGRIALDCTLAAAARLEYRVWTSGVAGVVVGGDVRVVPLPGRGVRVTGATTAADPGPCYIGCSTDPAFVGLTATMLASVEEYGDVPDAIVLVADFGLSDVDRAVLRASAGALGARMRFVAVDRDTPLLPVIPDHPFPFPLVGRFVLPKIVDAPDARLILIDSDMILTDSLRPLFDVDMEGHPVAAALDPMTEAELRVRGRTPDPSYFNAGLVVIDTARWNRAGISDAAMRRWAAYPERPLFLDQDALNDVVGDDWLRLDRSWNFFYAGEPAQFPADWYESAPIVHYAGAKPDVARDHPAVPLFDRQVARVAARTGWKTLSDRIPADRSFVTLCYEMFLGREPETAAVVAERVGQSALGVVATTVRSDEFRTAILAPLLSGDGFAPGLFRHPPTLGQRYWAADRLPLFADTAAAVVDARSWRALLRAVLGDACFRAATGLPDADRDPAADQAPVIIAA